MELGVAPVTSAFVSDAELALLADEGARGLYDLILTNQGKEYVSTDDTIATVIGQEQYELPTDFYQLLSVVGRVGDVAFDLPQWNTSEFAQLITAGAQGASPWASRYRITGTQSTVGVAPTAGVRKLTILPTPREVFTITILYVPACVRADDTTDDVYYDGVSGWEEWIIWDCVAKMWAKQEQDPSFALAQRAQVEVRIRALSGALDRVHPEVAQDWQRGRRARAQYRRWWRTRGPL